MPIRLYLQDRVAVTVGSGPRPAPALRRPAHCLLRTVALPSCAVPVMSLDSSCLFAQRPASFCSRCSVWLWGPGPGVLGPVLSPQPGTGPGGQSPPSGPSLLVPPAHILPPRPSGRGDRPQCECSVTCRGPGKTLLSQEGPQMWLPGCEVRRREQQRGAVSGRSEATHGPRRCGPSLGRRGGWSRWAVTDWKAPAL